MTTQTQGKGKKKNKEVTKLSLDEFNQTNAGEGYSVVNLKTGLDWAEAMADYDRSIVVPVVPRSQRGPDVDIDSLPDEPPFRASLYNLPLSVEEKDLRDKFFAGIDIKRIEISKQTTTVEFNTKNDLYEGLCKNGTSLKTRIIDVVPFGHMRPEENRSDRYGRGGGSYGDRQGGSSYGDRRERGSDRGGFERMGDRGGFDRMGSDRGGFDRMGERGGYNDRGFNRGGSDRDNFSGFSRSGTAENWRARPAPTVNKSQAPPQHLPAQQQPHYQPQQQRPYQPRYNQYHNHPPPSSDHHQQQHYNTHHSFQNNRPGPMNNTRQSNWGSDRGPAPPMGQSNNDAEERPKLIIKKRETPLDVDDISSVKRNEAIFGQAKPSSKPYEKMKEVEEKLKEQV